MTIRNPRALARSAHWCFQKLRECRDPDLAAELRFLASELLQAARARLSQARLRRRLVPVRTAA